ncbi:MAG: hypothetical protein ACREXY_09665, partial [Gammaproteobacteria bacterium]
ELKRALAEAAYGAKDQLKRSGDTISGKFGEGLSVFERAVDDTLDQSLGPRFGAANLTYRRLKGATDAADRTADRAQGNGLIGLKDMLAPIALGAGGLATGGLPLAAVGMGLGTRYGSQFAARQLYNLGRLTKFSPEVAELLAKGSARTPGIRALSANRSARLIDLLASPERYAGAVASGENQ